MNNETQWKVMFDSGECVDVTVWEVDEEDYAATLTEADGTEVESSSECTYPLNAIYECLDYTTDPRHTADHVIGIWRSDAAPDRDGRVQPAGVTAVLSELSERLTLSRERYPRTRWQTFAVAAELAELVEAYNESPERVRAEAIDVAAAAIRLALDGDESNGCWPTLEEWQESRRQAGKSIPKRIPMPRPDARRPESSAARLDAEGCRREVVAFAAAMERELRENDHKGGWTSCDPNWLLRRLGEEVSELGNATREFYRIFRGGPLDEKRRAAVAKARALVLSEAADVANFSMMIADVIGALDGSGPLPPSERDELAARMRSVMEAIRTYRTARDAANIGCDEARRVRTSADPEGCGPCAALADAATDAYRALIATLEAAEGDRG